MSFLSTVGKAAVTMVGAVVGAVAFPGGPLGLAIGTGVGGVIDFARAKLGASSTPTAVMPPAGVGGAVLPPPAAGGPTLPNGVNMAAAQNAVHLMLLGKPAEVQSAGYWLQQFQASAGVPATSKLDPTTRALLIQATAGSQFDASHLPPTTILG